MKGILEFNLPEDQEDFNLASKANGMYYSIILELEEYLRGKLKYPEQYSSEAEAKAKLDTYEEIRDLLRSLSNDEGIKY